MTIDEKKEALYDAINKAWDDSFDGWEWMQAKGSSKRFILGEKNEKNGFAFFLGSNEDLYNGLIWIEYEPDSDSIELNIKNRPIQPKFQEDFKTLFEKYSPFSMTLSFDKAGAPLISRKEQLEPKDFLKFFKEFKTAYKENYPLFYMFTVCEKKWFEEFCVMGGDC